MKLFPAIDILNERAVRLFQGRLNDVTDYGDPVEMAEKWQRQGGTYLHVVDLGAAFNLRDNLSVIGKICRAVKIPVETGGGIRTLDDIQARLDLGAARVILGTAAVKEAGFMERAAARFPDQLAIGIDCKDGFVAVSGWTLTTNVTALDFALKAKKCGIHVAVYTDISRDGAMTGVNVEATVRLQEKSGLHVIASGGVSSLEDIKRLKERGVYGAILGKSLYSGAIKLEEAICLENE